MKLWSGKIELCHLDEVTWAGIRHLTSQVRSGLGKPVLWAGFPILSVALGRTWMLSKDSCREALLLAMNLCLFAKYLCLILRDAACH